MRMSVGNGLIWAGLLTLVFMAIAFAVAGDYSQGFDRHFLLALRTGDTHDPIGPRWVETIFLEITDLGGNTVVALVTLAVAGFLAIDDKRSTALLVLASVGGGTALNNLLKLIFSRARPDLVAHGVDVQTTSFPSGHAMLSAIVYLTLGALLASTQKRSRVRTYLLALAVGLTAIIGISRVYLGVHWPTDIIAGWCAGAAWALICWTVAEKLRAGGDVEKATD